MVLDIETRFDREYSVKKLTLEEYIRDDRFEPLVLAGYSFNSDQSFHIFGPESIKLWIELQDWSKICVVAHNAVFDVGILSLRYGAIPLMIVCTMSIARAVFGPLKSVSLEALASAFDLPAKKINYAAFENCRWQDMDEETQKHLIEGCKHDVELTRTIACKLIPSFPLAELTVIDLTIRMFTQPTLVGDVALLKSIAEDEFARKNDILCDLNVTEKDLQSAAKFVALLEDCGEEVPAKPGKLGVIPCLAATDVYMQELSGQTGRAGELVRARLDVRSSIEQRRSFRLAQIAERGPIPVHLSYCAANTMRWGGAGRINMQNLPNDSKIRSGLMAPDGHKLIVIDFSQIEFRILCKLARQEDKLEALNDPARNLYCEFGATVFGWPITREDKDEYRFAKMLVLAAGYGVGKERVYRAACSMGFDFPRALTDHAVDSFRQQNPGIVALWRRLDRVLVYMELGAPVDQSYVDGIPAYFNCKTVKLPNGLAVTFDLKFEDGRIYRKTRRAIKNPYDLASAGYAPYWGADVTAWLCQSLARIRLTGIVLQAYNQLGLRPALLVHDEYVAIVPDKQAQEMLVSLLDLAQEPVDWWMDGPQFAAHGRVCERYGE